MSVCDFHTKDDPRFEAAKAMFMAADTYAHALAFVFGESRTADKVMKAVQMMLSDTLPQCLYEQAVVESVGELYPREDRERVAEDTVNLMKNSPWEPSAEGRERMAAFLHRLVEGE